MTAARLLVPALAAGFLAACGGTPPKPAELNALEQLRARPEAGAAAEQQPDLVGDSDQLRRKAEASWKSGKLDDSRELALMATVQLRTAIAKLEQAQAREQLAKLGKELHGSEQEERRLKTELRAVQEQVALLEELARTRAAAEADKQDLSGKLGREQHKGAVDKKIGAAELALKNADTVEAMRHAADDYKAALEVLARARLELDKGQLADAGASAERATKLAEQAFAAAKPKYEAAAEAESAKVRDEALARDAAAIAGVTVRLDRKGDVTRLRLPLISLFKGTGTTIRADKARLIDAVAALLAKYPTYPVQLIGYTDNRGKPAALIERSEARASAVFAALIQRGVGAKRFVVSGLGPESPLVDNQSRSGREANNRVEVVILYH